MFAVKVINLSYRVFNLFQIRVVHRARIDLLLLQMFNFGADTGDTGDTGECYEPEQAERSCHQ